MAQELRTPETTGTTLVDVKGLKVHFPIKGGIFSRTVATVKAVDGVDLFVRHGETLGLVGESGCGKSTTGRAILQLIKPTAGSIKVNDVELTKLSAGEIRKRRADMQMVFQDPYSSLSPRFTVGQIIAEPLENFHRGNKKEIQDEVAHMMEVLNLMEELQGQFGLTYLFIAHNLSVVKHISDRVAVMYLGRIAELAKSEELYEIPLHPYTQALLSAIPVPDPEKELRRKRIILEGDVPSPVNPPSGCNFHPRCWKAQQICREVNPPLEEKQQNHWAACHFPG